MMRGKLGAAMMAVLALSAVGTGSASAAATTTAAKWFTGASPGTELTGSKTLTGGPSGTMAFTSKVGAGLTPIELTSNEGECVSCTIENKEVTSKAGKVAFGTGKVLFKNVIVTTPAHCKVVSESGVAGQILTKVLNGHGDFMNGENAVAQVSPAAGATASYAALHLENNGGTCAAAGLYSLTGVTYITWKITAVFSASHTGEVSPAIDVANGGGMFIGSQKAEATGTAVAKLGTGEEFTIR